MRIEREFVFSGGGDAAFIEPGTNRQDKGKSSKETVCKQREATVPFQRDDLRKGVKTIGHESLPHTPFPL